MHGQFMELHPSKFFVNKLLAYTKVGFKAIVINGEEVKKNGEKRDDGDILEVYIVEDDQWQTL